MRKLISFLVSRLRKESFELDKDIPLGYLCKIALKKMVQLLWGVMVFRRFKCFVAPSATISCRSKIKTSGFLMVEQRCIVNALSREGIIFGSGVSIGRDTSIECTGSLKEIGKGFVVGDNVGLGEKCHYGCAGGIEIGDNTIVGIYVTILDGAVVGDGCVIAAGAVVAGKFPDNCIIGGVPAKIIKYRN